MGACGAPVLQNENGSSNVNEPTSPPVGSGLRAIARKTALRVLLLCGWCLNTVGGRLFDVGERLERWARTRLKEAA